VNQPAPQRLQREAVSSTLRALLSAPIVAVAGRDWIGRDLVTAGACSGLWVALEHDLIRSLAALGQWRAPADAIRVGIREFRYQRDLISADEFAGWLRTRGLTLADVSSAVERRLVRERDGRIERSPGDPGSALVALPAEAIYTGALQRCGRWLADRLVCDQGLVKGAAVEPGEDEVDRLLNREQMLLAPAVLDESEEERRARAELILAADRAHQALAARACPAQAIGCHIRRRALAWRRFEVVQFACDSLGAAAEIAALVRESCAQDTIRELSGLPGEHVIMYLEEAPAELQGALAGSCGGEVIGPARVAELHHVWLVQRRWEPSPDDPVIRARACAEIVKELLRKHRAGRVRWHDRH
jgi:hypothetical protein